MDLNVVVTHPNRDAHPTPVVFVHGAWHGAWCWSEHFTGYFADRGYTSYALDLRGHGASTGNLKSTRIVHYVHDVRRLALELEVEPVIIGHSMGGFIVQHYLARYRATAGVLMAPVPTTGAIGATLRVLGKHPMAFARANATLSLGPIVDDPERAASLLFGPEMNLEEALAYGMRMQDESYPAYLEMILDLPRASRVKDPMLVLGAQYDKLISPQEIRATARAYGTEPVIIRGMGHDMMLEPDWQVVADTIVDWLSNMTASEPTRSGRGG